MGRNHCGGVLVDVNEVLEKARKAATMVAHRVPYFELTDWGLKIKLPDGETKVISFAEMFTIYGIKALCLARVKGGFYEDWGYHVSPNGREANTGWQQTGRVALPETATGQVAVVLDRSGPEVKVLVEFREEALAMRLPSQVAASASAVASKSNLAGEHGFKGNKTYIALLDQLVELARIETGCDMARDVKRNAIIVLDWRSKDDRPLPEISHRATGKFYAWCTRLQLQEIAVQDVVSTHLLEPLGLAWIYAL